MTSNAETIWEYETVRPPREATREEADDPEELLNEFGSEGWEFIDTIEYSGGGTKFLVFRRPRRGDRDGNGVDGQRLAGDDQ